MPKPVLGEPGPELAPPIPAEAIARGKELRATGMPWYKIAEKLNYPLATVHSYCHQEFRKTNKSPKEKHLACGKEGPNHCLRCDWRWSTKPGFRHPPLACPNCLSSFWSVPPEAPYANRPDHPKWKKRPPFQQARYIKRLRERLKRTVFELKAVGVELSVQFADEARIPTGPNNKDKDIVERMIVAMPLVPPPPRALPAERFLSAPQPVFADAEQPELIATRRPINKDTRVNRAEAEGDLRDFARTLLK